MNYRPHVRPDLPKGAGRRQHNAVGPKMTECKGQTSPEIGFPRRVRRLHRHVAVVPHVVEDLSLFLPQLHAEDILKPLVGIALIVLDDRLRLRRPPKVPLVGIQGDRLIQLHLRQRLTPSKGKEKGPHPSGPHPFAMYSSITALILRRNSLKPSSSSPGPYSTSSPGRKVASWASSKIPTNRAVPIGNPSGESTVHRVVACPSKSSSYSMSRRTFVIAHPPQNGTSSGVISRGACIWEPPPRSLAAFSSIPCA